MSIIVDILRVAAGAPARTSATPSRQAVWNVAARGLGLGRRAVHPQVDTSLRGTSTNWINRPHGPAAILTDSLPGECVFRSAPRVPSDVNGSPSGRSPRPNQPPMCPRRISDDRERTDEREGTRSRRAISAVVVAGLVLAGCVRPANAALTTPVCVGQKLKAWGDRRKCQRTEDIKAVQGKPFDLEKCETKFQRSFVTINIAASHAGIDCRYRDNGDNTVTDTETGLMWVKLGSFDGFPTSFILDADDTFDFTTANLVAAALNGASNGRNLIPVSGNGLHGDWRLPTIVELRSILDASRCGPGSACLDPVFGSTFPGFYWTSTSANAASAWTADFGSGFLTPVRKQSGRKPLPRGAIGSVTDARS